MNPSKAYSRGNAMHDLEKGGIQGDCTGLISAVVVGGSKGKKGKRE